MQEVDSPPVSRQPLIPSTYSSEYAPISLNHLIQEGVRRYQLVPDHSEIAKSEMRPNGGDVVDSFSGVPHSDKGLDSITRFTQRERNYSQISVEFELELANNLHRVFGEPSQLRRLFECITNYLLKPLPEHNPVIRLETRNTQGRSLRLRNEQGDRVASPQVAVTMGIYVKWFCPVPSLEAYPSLSGAEQSKFTSQIFAWTQIQEVVQLHRGKLTSIHPTATSTAIELTFPAIRSLR